MANTTTSFAFAFFYVNQVHNFFSIVLWTYQTKTTRLRTTLIKATNLNERAKAVKNRHGEDREQDESPSHVLKATCWDFQES